MQAVEVASRLEMDCKAILSPLGWIHASLPLLWLIRHLFPEGGCAIRTGRHLLIIVVFMLASISGTVSDPGDDTGTVSALSTDCVGLSLRT